MSAVAKIEARVARGETSTQAASQFVQVVTGEAKYQRERILNFLRLLPAVGLSRTDLSIVLGIKLQSVCGRVGELKADGLVIEDAPRRCPHSGRMVKPVRIAPDLFTGA